VDNKAVDIVADRYAERVNMYKYNLKYIFGIEVAEQEVEMQHVQREVERVDWAAQMSCL
jgi:hypothetical protein